jgi:hypothetical protein
VARAGRGVAFPPLGTNVDKPLPVTNREDRLGERKGGSHLGKDGKANTNVEKPLPVTHREERLEEGKEGAVILGRMVKPIPTEAKRHGPLYDNFFVPAVQYTALISQEK